MKLGVVTDPHIAPPGTPEAAFHNPFDFDHARLNLRHALDSLDDEGVDSIVFLGDLANAGNLSSHEEGMRTLAERGKRLWAVPGNHDCDEHVDAFRHRITASYQNEIHMPSPAGEPFGPFWLAGLSITSITPGREWELQEPDVSSWPDGPVVMLTHFAAVSFAETAAAAELLYAGDVLNHARIAHLLEARRDPVIVLHGHHHLRTTLSQGPVLQIGFASLIEPPHEVGVVEIEADPNLIVRVSHAAVSASTAERLPILAPAVAVWRFQHGTWSRDEGTCP